MNAHLPCTTLYYNYVRLSTGLCKYFKQGSEANIRVHQMSGSTAGWSEIRSAVREEAGQGGAQRKRANGFDISRKTPHSMRLTYAGRAGMLQKILGRFVYSTTVNLHTHMDI